VTLWCALMPGVCYQGNKEGFVFVWCSVKLTYKYSFSNPHTPQLSINNVEY